MSRIGRGFITISDIADGVQGARNAVRYLYSTSTSDVVPSAPSATITWSTGSLSAITDGWYETPPTVDATGTSRPWVSTVTFHQASSLSQAATTEATGSTPKKGFVFDGVVTFTNEGNLISGDSTYDPVSVINSGTTTIDGGKITADSITAAEIDVDNLITTGSLVVGNDITDVVRDGDVSGLALLLNKQTDGTVNVGEAGLVGRQADGSVKLNSDGFVVYNGSKITIPRGNTALPSITILTNLADKKGFIVLDSTLSDKFAFAPSYGNRSVVFAFKEDGQWKYDTNDSSANFTPTETDLALGWMETSTADLILNGGLFGEPIPLSLVSEAGATVGADYSTNVSNTPDSLSDINSGEGTKLTNIESGATNTGGEWFKLIAIPDAQEPISGDSATFTATFTSNFSRAPKYGDIVLVEFATLPKKTYQYTNGWNEPSAVILGDMLVKGTVRADRVDVIGSEATVIIDGDNETPLVIENTTSGDYFKVKTGGRIEASDGIFEDGGVSLDKINQAELNAYVSQRLSEVGTFTAGIDETFTDTITLTSPDTVCVVGTALDASVDHTVEFRLQDSWAHSLVDITETAANGGPTGDLNIGYDIQGSTNGTSGWTSIDSGTAVADSVVIEGDTNGGGSTTETEAYDSGNYEWTLDYTYEDEFGGGGYFVDLTVKWNGATVYSSSIYSGGTKESNPNWTRTSVTVGENTYNRGTYDSNSGTNNLGSFYYGLTRVGSSTITNGLETFTLSLIRSLNPTTDYPYYRAVLTGFSNTDTFNGTTPTGGGSGAVAFDGVPSLRVYTAGSSSIFSAGDISVTTGTASGGGSLSYNNAGGFTFKPADLSSYATESYVNTAVSDLVDSSPTTLNTLNELANALGDDPNFATTTATSIGTKANKSGDTFTGRVVIDTANGWDSNDIGSKQLRLDAGDGYPTLSFYSNGTANWSIYKGGQSSWVGDGSIGFITHSGTADATRVKFKIDTSGNITALGTLTASGYNKSNWDTAYGWGNHASAGYLATTLSTLDSRYGLVADSAHSVYKHSNSGTGATWTSFDFPAYNNVIGRDYYVFDVYGYEDFTKAGKFVHYTVYVNIKNGFGQPPSGNEITVQVVANLEADQNQANAGNFEFKLERDLVDGNGIPHHKLWIEADERYSALHIVAVPVYIGDFTRTLSNMFATQSTEPTTTITYPVINSASVEAPLPPSVTSTTIVGETIEIVFSESSTSDTDRYEVWSDNGGSSYSLIGVIPLTDIASSMSFIDSTFTGSGTISYRVYAVKMGAYSTPATTTKDFTLPTLDVANLQVIPDINVFSVSYDIPDSRFVDHIEIYLDTDTLSSGTSRANASLVYSGNRGSYTHNINSANRDDYHQFWVEVVEG